MLRDLTPRGAMSLAAIPCTTGCCPHLVGPQAVLALVMVMPLVNPQAGHLVLRSLDLHPNHRGEMIHLTRRRCRAL